MFGNQNESGRIQELISIDTELNKIQDLDVLLERILRSARVMLSADAGSIYLSTGEGLQINYSQNDTMQADLPPGQKLIYNIFTIKINRKTISGYVASTKQVLNIPDAYRIPSESPFGFDTVYDKVSGYKTTSILTIPLLSNRGELFGVLQIINKKDKNGTVVAFSAEDEAIAIHFANNAVIALERAKMTRAILLRMIQMAELRDPKETGPHVNRVAGFSVEIYESWAIKRGLPRDKIDRDIDNLRMAAMLHDVGKVAISDVVLKKPGRFTDQEYEVMKTHTISGAKLFMTEPTEFDKMALAVALSHHENWDGTGYPGHVDVRTGKVLKAGKDGKALGKKGNEISIFGRIIALADVYDALRNTRVYKEAWSEDDTVREIERLSGSKFDPELVDIFLKVHPTLKTIADRYQD